MIYVLATLAIFCALTIGLGFWPPIHIHPLLETWLEPVLAPSAALVTSRLSAHAHNTVLEWVLIGASVGVGVIGWLLARAFYKDNKSAFPAQFVARYPTFHRWVFNKYYVDEFYQATVLRATSVLAHLSSEFDRRVVDGAVTGVAWLGRLVCNLEGAFDKYVVDGMVNAIADGALAGGQQLRKLQTGRIQNYLYAAVAGALAVAGINFFIK